MPVSVREQEREQGTWRRSPVVALPLDEFGINHHASPLDMPVQEARLLNRTKLVLFNNPSTDMIKLSRMADYGMILMVNLARYRHEPVTAGMLAEAAALPQPTVSKLLKQLAAAGLLQSRRGPSGGYELSRDPDSISVADIVSAVDGPVALTDCMADDGFTCEIEALCPTRSNWLEINNAMVNTLEAISLAHMARTAIATADTAVATAART